MVNVRFLAKQMNFTKLHLKKQILWIICLKELVKTVINGCVEKKSFDLSYLDFSLVSIVLFSVTKLCGWVEVCFDISLAYENTLMMMKYIQHCLNNISFQFRSFVFHRPFLLNTMEIPSTIAHISLHLILKACCSF